MPSIEKCCVCEKETPLGIEVREKRICVECSNKIFLKYQTFVEKPMAVDFSTLDKVKGLLQEKKELQSLSNEFRDILHSYDTLDDLSRGSKIPTQLMERLYTVGQRLRLVNILLTDLRSSLEGGDSSNLQGTMKKVTDELSFCKRELEECDNEMKKFVRN